MRVCACASVTSRSTGYYPNQDDLYHERHRPRHHRLRQLVVMEPARGHGHAGPLGAIGGIPLAAVVPVAAGWGGHGGDPAALPAMMPPGAVPAGCGGPCGQCGPCASLQGALNPCGQCGPCTKMSSALNPCGQCGPCSKLSALNPCGQCGPCSKLGALAAVVVSPQPVVGSDR